MCCSGEREAAAAAVVVVMGVWGKQNEEKMGTDNNVRESAYEGLRGDCTNTRWNTLAFIESITTPIIMQITIYTQRDGAKPASYYKP